MNTCIRIHFHLASEYCRNTTLVELFRKYYATTSRAGIQSTFINVCLPSQNEAAVHYLDGYVTARRLPVWSRAFYRDVLTQITHGSLVPFLRTVGMLRETDPAGYFTNVGSEKFAQMLIHRYITGITYCLLM